LASAFQSIGAGAMGADGSLAIAPGAGTLISWVSGDARAFLRGRVEGTNEGGAGRGRSCCVAGSTRKARDSSWRRCTHVTQRIAMRTKAAWIAATSRRTAGRCIRVGTPYTPTCEVIMG
jgi:hypothetical protein